MKGDAAVEHSTGHGTIGDFRRVLLRAAHCTVCVNVSVLRLAALSFSL